MQVVVHIAVLVLSIAFIDGQAPWFLRSRPIGSVLPIRQRVRPFAYPFPPNVLQQQNIITRRTRPLVRPPIRAREQPSAAVRAVITSLTSAIGPKERDVAHILTEIVQLLEPYSINRVISRITRAVVETFITGKALDVGFKQSMTVASAEVLTKTLKILNSLPGEQISVLQSTLANKFGLDYSAKISTEPPLPPKYEMSPEVKTALENILKSLRSLKTANPRSEKILSDIIKIATSAEFNTVVPPQLSSSAKIVVDAFVSGRKLKPGHPSSSILEALRRLPEEEANLLIEEFLKVLALSPQGDLGIIDGVSSIVLEEKNLTEAIMKNKTIAEAERKFREQLKKTNQNRISQLELEQRRREKESRAAQLRSVEEQNRRAAEEASRQIELMKLENKRRIAAEKERLRRIESRKVNEYESLKRYTEMLNARPVDIDRELWNMNLNVLQQHGPEARKWLADAKSNKLPDSQAEIIDSQVKQNGTNGTANARIINQVEDTNILTGNTRTVSDRNSSGVSGNGNNILSSLRGNNIDTDVIIPQGGNFLTPLRGNSIDFLPQSRANRIDPTPASQDNRIDLFSPSRGNIEILPSSRRNGMDVLTSSGTNILSPTIPSATFNIPPPTRFRRVFPGRHVFNTVRRVPSSRIVIRNRRPIRFQNRLPIRNFDSRFRPIYFQR